MITCNICGSNVNTLAKRRHRCRKLPTKPTYQPTHIGWNTWREASCVMCHSSIHTWKAEILCSKDCESDYWDYLHGSGCKPLIRLN